MGMHLGTTGWENRRREESGRELATKTEPEKIREGMGDKQGRSKEKKWEEPARIGKGQERTWKGRGRTREVSYIMQRTCLIQFGPTYMQQCIYYFMLSVSVLDQVRKRPQGPPFGQEKLTKLALDHGCGNMAPVQ